ncbi:hypothetical protein GCM10008959_34170 [Deinococcus seoulensis]|uniref:VWA domain-containing protein n=1 Tax=Deinococcus seoulensis TaxID=1837379 RepID=A0ABQ2RUZ3_9DEIO|nr:hypothetical protein [Deinococcus seoulensis]GGR69306.1 hypothetical protein GCM10008959_34170 [Deinococcus seoulensis]
MRGASPQRSRAASARSISTASAGWTGQSRSKTDPRWSQYRQAIDTARANGTRVYAIGLDAQNNLDFSALEDIAAATGGLFQKANDDAALDGFFDRMYNAFRAQGCVELVFTQKPAAGTEVTGTLNIVISAADRKPATVEVPFAFTVR